MSFGFDLTNVKVEEGRGGCLPAGTYTARIEKVEKKTSKSNPDNKYLNVQYKVCNMEKRNGAVFFDTVNIHNQSQAAQDIGRSRLKAMLLACGVQDVKNADESNLIGSVVTCVLGVEKREGYEDRSKVFQILPAENSGNSGESKVDTGATGGWA